jgi:hypothetical protein
MELTFECPRCGTTRQIPAVESAVSARCECGWERALCTGASGDGALQGCSFCGAEDLYRQKDFPHILGLGIVIAGFAISSVFWYFYRPVAALAALLVVAAFDLVLYYVVSDLTICYRCQSQFRGAGSNPDGRYLPFDLAIGERYRQERLRVDELRRRGASVPAAPQAGPPGP